MPRGGGEWRRGGAGGAARAVGEGGELRLWRRSVRLRDEDVGDGAVVVVLETAVHDNYEERLFVLELGALRSRLDL